MIYTLKKTGKLCLHQTCLHLRNIQNTWKNSMFIRKKKKGVSFLHKTATTKKRGGSHLTEKLYFDDKTGKPFQQTLEISYWHLVMTTTSGYETHQEGEQMTMCTESMKCCGCGEGDLVINSGQKSCLYLFSNWHLLCHVCGKAKRVKTLALTSKLPSSNSNLIRMWSKWNFHM